MGEVVLTTERLDRIVELGDTEVTVQAGVPLTVLRETLEQRGALYPPIPTFEGAFAGGVVATNAAGAGTFKYGSTRDWVRRLTVILADGSVLGPDTRSGARASRWVLRDRHRRLHQPSQGAPTYEMPAVPKRSAGYFAAPAMDLVDLFVGSEGTLGVVTEITFAIVSRCPSTCLVWIPVPSEAEANRARGHAAIRSAIDVAVARPARDRCRRNRASRPTQPGPCERGRGRPHAQGSRSLTISPSRSSPRSSCRPTPCPHPTRPMLKWASALDARSPDTPLVRLCRLLAQAGVADRTEIALPQDRRRHAQLMAIREAVPEAVNRRVGRAQRDIDPAIEKTAADMIVPFDRFAESVQLFRTAFEDRRLDYAMWGHISDGNVHPNVIPRSLDDVRPRQRGDPRVRT